MKAPSGDIDFSISAVTGTTLYFNGKAAIIYLTDGSTSGGTIRSDKDKNIIIKVPDLLNVELGEHVFYVTATHKSSGYSYSTQYTIEVTAPDCSNVSITDVELPPDGSLMGSIGTLAYDYGRGVDRNPRKIIFHLASSLVGCDINYTCTIETIDPNC